AQAPARRRAARPAHFDQIRAMVEKGQLRAAGAILDDDGTMIGSVLFMEFSGRPQLDAWLERDPYMTEKVWQKIEVKPFRLAVLDGKITQ
ncbi:MAG TPA: YciI family protein, partial [Alphaproteobacteria bacterium]|nr:YciI family protein [Alphaproteobacteria bacterium]